MVCIQIKLIENTSEQRTSEYFTLEMDTDEKQFLAHCEPAPKRMCERKVPYHHRLYQRNYQGGKKKNILFGLVNATSKIISKFFYKPKQRSTSTLEQMMVTSLRITGVNFLNARTFIKNWYHMAKWPNIPGPKLIARLVISRIVARKLKFCGSQLSP